MFSKWDMTITTPPPHVTIHFGYVISDIGTCTISTKISCASLSSNFWKRCFLKTSVSNGIIYTKYTQNPHTIEPPFNIATQSAT